MRVRRGRWARDAAVTAAAVAIAGIAFLFGTRVPILGLFDLGIHELGHLLATPLPRLAMFMAGSIAQVAFPLAMAAYFLIAPRDHPAGGFCLAWAGASARDVSVYAADARTQALPLIGGEHDWAYILGPSGFDALEHTATVAGSIEALGGILALSGIVLGGLAVQRSVTARSSGAHDPLLPAGHPLPATPAASTKSRDGDPWG
jgi:hypothetical protein